MAPPPPAQKGRFKPRKPAKKIAAPTDGPKPDAVSSSSSARPPPRPRQRSSAGSGIGGGRGGGRGRGRAPLPRGQVFFTGDEKVKKAGETARGHKRGGAGRKDEEIVETVEGGVGSTERKIQPSDTPSALLEQPRFFDDMEQTIGTGPLYFDSDSSTDQVERKGKKKGATAKKKHHQHPETTPITLPYVEKSQKTSFFSKEVEDGGQSSDDWFLIQLPTRLPKVRTTEETTATDKGTENNPEDTTMSSGATTTTLQTAMVATKPVLESAFDNTLTKAPPGRVGTILVYKSGRSELVLSNGVKLDLVEGLTCTFEQHAVAIDMNNGSSFVPLGKVKLTAVATPNVNDKTAWE